MSATPAAWQLLAQTSRYAGKSGWCSPKRAVARKAKSSGVDTKLGKSASLSPNPTRDSGASRYNPLLERHTDCSTHSVCMRTYSPQHWLTEVHKFESSSNWGHRSTHPSDLLFVLNDQV